MLLFLLYTSTRRGHNIRNVRHFRPCTSSTWYVSYFLSEMTVYQFFQLLPSLSGTAAPETIELVIKTIRGKFPPFSQRLQYSRAQTPDDELELVMKRIANYAVINRLTDTLRIVYKYGYYVNPDHAEHHYFYSADPDIACLLMVGVIRRDANFGQCFPNSIPIPDRLLREAVLLERTAAIQVVLEEKSLPRYHMRLLSYAIAMNRVPIVIQILDNCVIPLRKKHFYRAVTRGYSAIVSVFISHGFDYSRYNKETITRLLSEARGDTN